MNLIKKYSLILFGALLIIFASCTDEIEREPSPVQTGGVQAFFSAENKTSVSFLPSDPTEFTITIGRQNVEGEVTVELLTEDDEDLLILDDFVVFGANEAYTELKVDFSEMDLGDKTTLKLNFKNEADKYLYGLSALSIDVLRDYEWIDAGSVEFLEDDFGLSDDFGGPFKVPIQQAKGTELFRLPNLYHEMTVAMGDDDPVSPGYHLQFYIDTVTYAAKSIDEGAQNMGTGYHFYWDLRYGAYLNFKNSGSSFNLGYLLLLGNSLYVGGSSFVWSDGYKGEEPDPFSGEDVNISSMEKEMEFVSAEFEGVEYFSYRTTDIYGSDSIVYVAEYTVELINNEDNISLNLDILTEYAGKSEIPAGEYPINNSDLENTVRAGNSSELPYGSYVRLPSISEKTILYLVSGVVTVSYDDDDLCTIEVDTKSGKGSGLKFKWTGELVIE